MTRAQGGIRAWLVAVVVAGATLFIAPSAAHASGAGTLAADINAARASAGLRTLTYDGSLSAVAQSWANHMAAADNLSHNPSTPAQIRSGWSAWGENVGFTTTGSAATLHQAFMASSGHRANILNRSFTSMGVGWASKNGHTYVAEVFAAYPQATPSGSSKSGSGSSKSSSTSSPKSSSKSSSSSSSSSSTSSSSGTAGGTASRTAAQPTTSPTTAPQQPVHPAGLVLGDAGPKVRAMQVRLGVHGHQVRADGVFGPVTDRAVRAFQHDAGLTVDGVVGTRTGAALARPAPKKPVPAAKATPARTPAPRAPASTDAPAAAPDAALLAVARTRAAARSDASRAPLATRLSPSASTGAFVAPVAFAASLPATTATGAGAGGLGPSTAATLGTLLTLAAAAGAAAIWAARRRRAE